MATGKISTDTAHRAVLPIHTVEMIPKRMIVTRTKGKGTQFNDYVLTTSVSVGAFGCEQLAQSHYAPPAPDRGSNSRPLDRKSDAIPYRHNAHLLAKTNCGTAEKTNMGVSRVVIGVKEYNSGGDFF